MPVMELPNELATVGTIAKRTGYTEHQIRYVLRSRKIAPSGRIGQIRVFLPAEVDMITQELDAIVAGRFPLPSSIEIKGEDNPCP